MKDDVMGGACLKHQSGGKCSLYIYIGLFRKPEVRKLLGSRLREDEPVVFKK
jgi:hypothetical protein